MRLMRIVRSVGPESAGAGENQDRTMAVVTGVGKKTGGIHLFSNIMNILIFRQINIITYKLST